MTFNAREKGNVMNRISRVATVVTTGVLGGVLLLSGQASATGSISVFDQGNEAGRVNYWSGSKGGFRVSDTLCDNHSVYAQYQRAGASTRTLRNSKGCHTYADFHRGFTRGQTIKYRVCVDVPLQRDKCGKWKWDTTGS
jgi:hypothetical protein